MNKKISKNLFSVLLYLKRICTKIKGGKHSELGIIGNQHNLMNDFEEGKIFVKYEKELIAITNFEGRIHKNNSPRKKYLNGVYGGIPMPADIDFEELIENLN